MARAQLGALEVLPRSQPCAEGRATVGGTEVRVPVKKGQGRLRVGGGREGGPRRVRGWGKAVGAERRGEPPGLGRGPCATSSALPAARPRGTCRWDDESPGRLEQRPGLHLASIAPWGPIDGGPGGPAACDERRGIDFHLIDNLVNLFAKPQVGPEGAWKGHVVGRCPWPEWQPGGGRGQPDLGKGGCQGGAPLRPRELPALGAQL